MTTFLSDRAIYERVIRDTVPRAARRVWIATADFHLLQEEQFDAVWRGDHCRDCGRRDVCGDPVA